MAKPKPPKTAAKSHRSIPGHASEWLRQFSKHFSLYFIDAGCSIPADAPAGDYQEATVLAMYLALLDSGMDSDSFVEAVGRVWLEGRPGSTEWNSQLNQRRFKLIDKEIDGTLTPAESVELAGLTRIMRDQLDSEANLPLEGAKELHRKLMS